MLQYAYVYNNIITIDVDIIINITDINETNNYTRIGSGYNKFICGEKLPIIFNGILYNSIDILKKANGLYDYSKELNGLYTSYYINGTIKEEYYYINLKKNGLYTSI
jgi:hypothetical protein